MYSDIVDLREFYLSPLGRTVRRRLRARVEPLWPQVRGERVLALGYGVPLLRPMLEKAGALIALMPAEQGVSYWPREGPNISGLVDVANLPLPDSSIDRVIIMHALEGAAEPRAMLGEIWRVLKSGGRMLMIVANRRGLWAHSDRTPFGTGQPYSTFQIKDTLRDHGFLIDKVGHALYMPPSSSRVLLPMADFIEKYGEKIFPGFGGVLVIEANKQLYAPTLREVKSVQRRLVLPLPLSATPAAP